MLEASVVPRKGCIVLPSPVRVFSSRNVARCSIRCAVAKRQRPSSYLWQQQGTVPDV